MKNIQKGFIGVFDILGYKNVIKNNDIKSIAELVTDTIEKIPTSAKEDLINDFKEDKQKEIINAVMDLIDVLIISDTIVVCMPLDLDENKNETFRTITTMFFFSFLARLLRKLCDIGLPIRGGVDYGEYFAKNKSVAGHPFLNAFLLSENLEFVGCAITKEASNGMGEVTPINKKDGPFWNLVFKYLAPLKEEESKLYLLNWFYPYKRTDIDIPRDIKQYLVDSFHGYSKDVPKSAHTKINNTEIILRYAASKAWQKSEP
jgi:hypothetical protein